MGVDKIDVVNDSRIQHKQTKLNGREYHYLLAEPQGAVKGTVFLIHGWPDISMGWRYQIPLFLSLGLRVVCPDLMGFGRTEMPAVNKPEDLSAYGFKQVSNDLVALAKELGVSQIILGGHDWGGAVVWRVCLWHPEFVTHLFSICTPYFPPGKGKFLSLETRVKTIMPNFAYQLQLASGEPETIVVGKDKIRQFLKGMYGGTTPEKEPSFSVKEGILYDRLDRIQMTPLLSEAELEYYTEEYVRNGIGGSLAWYKTSEVNFNEDQELNQSEIPIPTLFVAGLKDAALIPAMSRGMEQHIPKLTRKEVNTGHWALWEDPATVNSYLKEWLEGTYFADKNKL